ncbi:hypothetical protein [Wenxinia marina]|uniref:Uncharacterized protein n=1 Tax=Wenxinia marina DSM 24838 TaxID=1123501 RepID=A0A0D0QCQ8_9RHOB|nr:hypothetical protein [Wenxinia marina]KIQ68713.1 hypothetical protein Wenmar_02438 [Wenxinia marina DSM 24838]GGL65832.1 hypothetical protein GCM10011392_20580 [Wenxinia marina]
MIRTSLIAAGALALSLAGPAGAGGFADEIVEAPPAVIVEPPAPRGSLPGWVIPAVLVAGLIALAVSGDDSDDDEGVGG